MGHRTGDFSGDGGPSKLSPGEVQGCIRGHKQRGGVEV